MPNVKSLRAHDASRRSTPHRRRTSHAFAQSDVHTSQTWGSKRWASQQLRSSTAPKERYSEVVRVEEGHLPSALDAPMQEVIGALHEQGDEFVPLATALRRLVESGELSKRSGSRRSTSTSPRLTVWPHKLMGDEKASSLGADQAPVVHGPPQTAPAFQLPTSHREDGGGSYAANESNSNGAMPESAEKITDFTAMVSAPSGLGSRFDSLFRNQSGGLASRVAEVAKSIPVLPIDSTIEDLVTDFAGVGATSASGSRAEQTARALDAAFETSVPPSVSSELQRLLDISSQAAELHPRTVCNIVRGAHSTSEVLRRAMVYLARSLAHHSPADAPEAATSTQPDAAHELCRTAAMHSLVAESTADLLDGMIHVARVTAESLEGYRADYDRSTAMYEEVVRERDELRERIRLLEAS